MRIKLYIVLISISAFIFNTSTAQVFQKFSGFELKHQWVSDSTWKMKLRIYVNCKSPDLYFINIPNHISDTCNFINPQSNISGTIFFLPYFLADGRINGSRVKLPCNMNTYCDSSIYATGYRIYEFECNRTLLEKCGYWSSKHLSRGNNDRRDSNITNLEKFYVPAYGGFQAGDLYFQETCLNFSDTTIKNNSCEVINPRPIYVNKGVPVNYSLAAQDTDGDSLVYHHVSSKKKGNIAGFPLSPTSNIPFVSPFTLSEPFATNGTFAWDSTLGIISFTAAYVQNPLISMVIDEYRHGVWVGNSMYDIPIVILNDSTPLPTHTLQPASLSNVSLVGMDSLQACAGLPISFCSMLSSVNAGAQLVVTDSLNPLMAGATLSYGGMGSSAVQACVSWSPTLLDTGWHAFTLTVRDTVCPAGGIQSPQTYPIHIYIAPPPVHIQPIAYTLCAGDSLTLTATGGSGLYTWQILSGTAGSFTCLLPTCQSISVFPTQATSYQVSSGSNALCANYDTIHIKVIQDFTVQASDTTLCSHPTTVQLQVHTSGHNIPLQYHWLPLSNVIGSATDSMLLVLPSMQQYTVSVSDTAHCFTHTDTVLLIYDASFAPQVLASSNDICLGDTVWLSVQGANNATIAWLPTTYLSASNVASPYAVPDSNIIYQLHAVSNVSQCLFDTTLGIVVSTVHADAGADQVISYGEKVQLGGSLMRRCATCSLRWYPDYNLHYPTTTFPSVFPALRTTYWVIVKNATETCVSIDSVVVDVNCNNLFLANAFNPNSDMEVNQTFGPNNRSLQLEYFKIYNRRGQLVFSTSDVNQRWDGTFGGEPAALDTYYWMMSGHCATGEKFFKKGDVILVR